MSRGARIAGAVALWLGALVVGLYFTSSSNDNDAEGANPEVAAGATTTTAAVTVVTTPSVDETTTTAAAATTTTAAATTTTAPPTTTTTTAAPIAAGIAVAASLDSGRFAVRGVVPDQQTADQIVQSATIVYGPEFERDLTIDPSAAAPEWLPGLPRAVTLLPIIGEGTLQVDATGVVVSGASPNDAALGALAGAVEQTLGVAPDVSAVEITGLDFPSFNARRVGDTLVLTGALANDAVKTNIVDTAVAIYGPGVVDDQIAIGENLDIPFWSYTMPGVLQLFAEFPDYEIDIQNGVTGGSLNDGANFETGSAELNQNTISILPIALGIMTRDPSLGMEIAGHTDSNGSTGFNQALSEARAQAAADWLIAAGIDANRIVAIGFGESQPIGDNSTSEGRATNRRVEFRFGPAVVILGG